MDFGLWCELNLPRCVVYSIPLGAEVSDLLDLKEGLLAGIKNFSASIYKNSCNSTTMSHINAHTKSTYIKNSGFHGEVMINLSATLGYQSAETVVLYPPGIPILIRGETITSDHILLIDSLQESMPPGVSVLSSDRSCRKLKVYNSYESPK